jgi:tRNA(Ile)-lysidine synthase
LPGGHVDQEKVSTSRAWNAGPTQIKGVDIGIEGKITVGMGLKLSCLKGDLLELRWQNGNARLRPTANGRHRRVKHLFQEAGVPPWERSRLPLVYYADQLACVPGVAMEHSLSASVDEPGIQIMISDLRITGG